MNVCKRIGILTLVGGLAVVLTADKSFAGKPPKPPPGGDNIAPAGVTDLQAADVTEFRVTLQWTAPPDDGDDCGSGPASEYDIRYSMSPIVDQADWDAAWVVYGVPPVPGAPCVLRAESKVVFHLLPDTTYYFRMKAADEAPNWSDLSNEAVVTTPPGIWSWEQIDNQASRTALAFAPDGTPSLAYLSSDGVFLFADYNGATWDIEVVGPGTGVFDLVYDGAGTPLIMHARVTSGKKRNPPANLEIFRRNGSSWGAETVDVDVVSIGVDSMAVDLNGNPAIGYRKGDDVKLARWNSTSSSWDLEVVESLGGYPESANFVSVAFDPSDGDPSLSYSVSYGAGEIADLRFARWTGSAWLVETVDAGTNLKAGAPGGLAYDPITGHPSIVYHLAPPSYMELPWTTHLTTWDGADWVIDLIDEEDATGTPMNDPTLAIDASGVPWVAYTRYPPDCSGDQEANKLRVASRVGGVWVSETPLETAPCRAATPDLQIDPTGIPVIGAYRQRYGRSN